MTDHYWLKEVIILGVHTRDFLLIWEGHVQVTIIKHCFSLLVPERLARSSSRQKEQLDHASFKWEKLVSLIMDEPVRKYFRKD